MNIKFVSNFQKIFTRVDVQRRIFCWDICDWGLFKQFVCQFSPDCKSKTL